MTSEPLGLAGRLAHAFIHSKLTPLIVAASILLGVGAVLLLPREEEPQIIVPMIDIFVQMPGASAKEVEERVTKPMEKLLWEIPGVEYIYSTSSPGHSMAIVRFYRGGGRREIHRPAQPEDVRQLRPDSSRGQPAPDQTPVHRRRPHPGPHPLERHLEPFHASTGRRPAPRPDQRGPRCLGSEDHRRAAATGPGHPR